MKRNYKLEKDILAIVYNYFANSAQFNGLVSYNLNFDCPKDDLVQAISYLIKDKKVSLLASEHDANPHIIRFGFMPIKDQLQFLLDNKLSKEFCLYPAQEYLSTKVTPEYIPQYPFKYMMSLGVPQFKACYFEWGVLYKYFSDPRYRFLFSDYIGSIESSDVVDERNYINLRTFGVGRDASGNQVVVAFPRDLVKMSFACQVEWYNSLVRNQKECKILDSYMRNLFEGCWNFPHTVYRAVLQEISNINYLSKCIFDHTFFRDEYIENKPVEFDMIYIPTYKAYCAYLLILEKIVVSNIDDKFFEAIDWPRIDDEGKIKGTLACLKEFIHKVCPQAEDEIVVPMKMIRKQRQAPAHKIEDNRYDISYLNLQHEITAQAFNSLYSLRRLFQSHPKAKDVELRYKYPEKYIMP